MSNNLILHNGMTGKEMAGILDTFIWPDDADTDVCYETLRFVQDVLFSLSKGDIECLRLFIANCEEKNKTTGNR